MVIKNKITTVSIMNKFAHESIFQILSKAHFPYPYIE